MFDVFCPDHGSRVLLGSRSIESIVNTPDGIVVHWRCHCGARGALPAVGRSAVARPPARAIAAA